MRLFPRARRWATPVALLAGAVVLSGSLVVPTASPWSLVDEQSDLEREQRSVRGDIADKADDLEESTAEVSAAGAALIEAETSLSAAQGRLLAVQDQLEQARGRESQLAAELVDTQADLAAARADLAAGQAATAAQRQQVADTISELYQRGDSQVLAYAAVLNAQTPADITRQMNFSDVVVGKQDTLYDDLRATEASLGQRQGEVEKAEADVAARRAAAAENVEQVRALEADAEAQTAEVAGLVDDREAARQQAEAAQAADAAALEELRRQDADIKKQILRAKRKAAAAAAAAARNQAPPPAAAAVNGLSGGRLLAPVTGPITSPFGYRVHPIYGYWGLHDGTDFGVACGQPLRAAGAGTVLTTVYSSSYGNRLFLDLGIVDGKALTVVYNHLSGFAASAGDVVTPGETVGYVGSTGWSTGCHLHFTVLEDGNPVDPMTYL